MITTGLMLASLAMPASAANVDTVENPNAIVAVEDGGEEIGFVDKYFPWGWDPLLDQAPLEPEIQENFWVIVILGVILGPVYAFVPTLLLDESVQVHDDFMMEQLVGGFVGWATSYIFGIGAYLNAVGIIHRLDRNIKKARGKPPAKWEGGQLAAPQPEAAAMAF